MATGQKISAMTPATTFSGSDELVIVQSGTNKSLTHDVLMEDPQICQAWVNFDGTGTPSIRDSYNVSSITDNGTGDYTINFTNTMNDINYSACGFGIPSQTFEVTGRTVNSIPITTTDSTGTAADYDIINVIIYGGV